MGLGMDDLVREGQARSMPLCLPAGPGGQFAHLWGGVVALCSSGKCLVASFVVFAGVVLSAHPAFLGFDAYFVPVAIFLALIA